MTTAVLWYSPAARFSKREATMTTPCVRASCWKASVDGTGDRLGQVEAGVIFRLAEVLRAEEFLGADDLGAIGHRPAGERELTCQVGVGIRAARHLREADLHEAAAG